MRKPWTSAELTKLVRLYPDTPTAELAVEFGRTERAVYGQADLLGLKKSAAYLASPAACRTNGRQGIGSRFQKGNVPANKGKSGITGHQPGCRRTQFRKGRPAHEARNYQPIGTERICRDGYLERKVTDDPNTYPARRWVGVHRIVWEAANGPAPAGHAVVFKDGRRTTNADEITLDRLELVSRGELMRRNSYHTRYPKDVALLIQLRGALNRKINRRAA